MRFLLESVRWTDSLDTLAAFAVVPVYGLGAAMPDTTAGLYSAGKTLISGRETGRKIP